jgi:ribonuclease HII
MSQKIIWTIGIDEAGRGPIAGPVAVGVVAVRASLPEDLRLGKDSKQLSPKARASWFGKIEQAAQEGVLQYACALVDATIIDKQGITAAIRQGISEALAQIDHQPAESEVLLDGGLRAPSVYQKQQAIIRGDASVPLIALASVVAKVTRDAYMEKMATIYPEYGFERHKGYGTKAHYEAIRQHGVAPVHRASFLHL